MTIISDDSNQDNNPKTDRYYPAKVLFIITAIALLVNYVETMVIPGIPNIQTDLSTTPSVASWITSSFLIVGAASSPLIGKLGDIYGKKKILLFVLIFYIAGVALAGFSPNIIVLITARAIQGVGFSILPLGLAIITDTFPKSRVAMAQGIISATFAVGATAGLVIGSYVIQDLSWHWAFHTAFMLSIVLFILAAIMLKKDESRKKSKVDYIGAALLMSGVVLVLVYLTEAPTIGWTSSKNLTFLIIGVILTISFFFYEHKRVSPLIKLSLLKIRNVFIANIVGILSNLCMFLIYFAVIYYAQYPKPFGLGMNIISTGLTLAPATLLLLIVGPIMGRLVSKIGPKPLLIFGASVSIIGLLLFAFNRGTTTDLTIDVAVGLMGLVSLFIPLVNMVALSIPKENTAVGLGMNTLLRNLGGAIGPVLAATIMSTHYTVLILPHPPYFMVFANSTAFNIMFAIGIILSIVVIVISLFVKNYKFAKKQD